ncbi:MAG: PilZ domain-containing protein [Nannocystaceae bacterium]
MASSNAIDRRRSPRVESIHLVTYETAKTEDAATAGASVIEVGRTLDVSAHGVRVETSMGLPVGSELALEIAVGERVIRAGGRVVHAEETGEGRWEVGVRLTRLAQEDAAALLE